MAKRKPKQTDGCATKLKVKVGAGGVHFAKTYGAIQERTIIEDGDDNCCLRVRKNLSRTVFVKR